MLGSNAQYLRHECMEVIGIPKTVGHTVEHTVCKVFNSIGFDIGEDRIEACVFFLFSISKLTHNCLQK